MKPTEKNILKTATLAAALIFITVSAVTIGAESKERSGNPVARLETNKGTIDIELFQHAAPKTVANFIGLAEGSKPFSDPKTGATVRRKYYNGLIFHRVIDDFMIQGGCPLGTGSGNPGYAFEDEINANALGLDDKKAITPEGQPNPLLGIRSQQELNSYVLGPLFTEMGITTQEQLDARAEEFEKKLSALSVKDVFENMGYRYTPGLPSYQPLKGYVAMANSGPNTNGSQFFINLIDTPWLAGKHTVFGKVIKGMDVVEAIGNVETGSGDKPKRDVVIQSVTILR